MKVSAYEQDKEELIMQVRKAKYGDKEAFCNLIRINKVAIYRIAKSILIKESNNLYKKRQREIAFEKDHFSKIKVNDTYKDLTLHNAINSLDDDLRTITILFYFEDLKYKDIAKVLGIKEGTVKSRLSRAKERLFTMLKEEFHDEYLNNKVEMESEKFILPKSFEDKIEETLESLDKKNLEKEEKWYFNKNIWITAACFAFISLTVLVTNKNNNETTNDLIRMSSEMDNNSSMVSYNNAESGSIREYSSNESVEEQLESNININDSFIDYNNINKIIIKFMDNINKYKTIDKRDDIRQVIDFINYTSKKEIEKQDINNWDFLIQTNGIGLNHNIIIKDDIMIIDDKWYKIDLNDNERLKNVYNDLNYNEKDIPYCDY